MKNLILTLLLSCMGYASMFTLNHLSDKEDTSVFMVTMTGARGNIHNNDCKRIDGSFTKTLRFGDLKNEVIRPISGTRRFNSFKDANTSWRRGWTPKKIAPIVRGKNTSPKNHYDMTLYKIDNKLLHNKNLRFEVDGFFQGCHKSGDFASDYNCANVYRGGWETSLYNMGKSKNFQVTFSSTAEHKLIFYFEISKV